MTRPRHFLACERGATAAEFALVLPAFLLLLFGTLDLGRFAWELNRAERATQVGARWAVATDMIASGLKDYSFAASGEVPQGEPVSSALFGKVVCEGTASSVTCSCTAGSCPFPVTSDSSAFKLFVERMQEVYPRIDYENVRITYSHSGLGFAGDPNAPDVAPLTTVSLHGIQFNSIVLLGGQFEMPAFPYTLPMEDGSGTTSN